MPSEWHRIVVEPDPSVAVVQNGIKYQGLRLTVPDEVVEQIRHGYQCIECLEPLETAFPKKCPLCSFPIREEQAEAFAQAFKGHVPGARTGADWDAEADRIEERKERRAFEKKASESGIVVPKALG